MDKIRVTIWNEFLHEKEAPQVAAIYPEGLHKAIADGIAADDLEIRLATLDEPENGLPDSVLNTTDVLVWWGHCAHREVSEVVARKAHRRILEGMGLIALHSSHFSRIFGMALGCSGTLHWREAGEKERLWNIAPTHPITQGIGEYFELEHEEMYGERFDIPDDGRTIFLSWFEGGDVFRSGVAFERGYGRIFYFQPGHEAYPNYYDRNVLRVIGNAVRWAKPKDRYGQFCSAQAVFQALLLVVANWGGGLFIDWTGDFRNLYVWDIIFTTLALIAMIQVYRGWIRHGGMKNYVAP